MLRIKCLGQLTVVRDDGTPLAGAASQPRRLAILALLARAGDRGITREKVIGYLWPDSDEERARRLLSQAVYMLRRDLESDDAIVGVRDLRLGPEVITSDVGEFGEALAARAYEQAASIYNGPFLDGFHLPGADEFERWVDEERRVLEHDSDVVFEKCAVAAEARGDHPSAVVWWRRIAAKDPINARVAIRLMRALAASGDRNGAIRHAAIHQALVSEQLDLPADAEVVRLADELRTGTAPVGPIAMPAGVATTSTTAASTPLLPPPTEAVVRDGAAESPPATRAVADSAIAPPAITPDAGVAAQSARRRSPGVLAGIAVGAALLVGVGFWIARDRAQAQAAVVVPSRVVVAPLENRTGDPKLDAVGTMVADWVTQSLLRTGLVQVVDGRTMLETARDVGPTRGDDYLRTLAERTGAGTLVSGSYFVEGDQLRFMMRVTGAPSGEVRHTVDVVNAPVSRPTAALEPLRQRITGALAVLLDPRLNNWTARTSQPPTYEAYAEFLLGMDTFGADYENSVRHFTRASQLDSSYWQAMLWAGMSFANLRRYPPADSLFRILDRNRANLASYDQANLDYFYSGFVRGDWEASYRGARRMLELAPSATHAFYAAGVTAQITNRSAEAARVLQQVNTDNGWGKAWATRIYNLIARSYHQLGNYDRDLEWAQRVRASEPNVGWTHLAEVKALAALGRPKEALAVALEGATFPASAETWEEYSPGEFLCQSGRELRAHGHSAEATEAFQRAKQWYESRPVEEQGTRGYKRGHAHALDELGRWADARAIYLNLYAEDSLTIEHLGALGVLAARLGRTAEADSIARRLASDSRPYMFGAPRLWQARIAAVKGDREGAVSLIHQAVRDGFARTYLLHAEHDYDSLRDFPAFREMLRPRVTGAP